MKDDRLRYFADNMDRLSRRDRVFLNNPVIMQGLGLAPIVLPAVNIRNAIMIAVAVILLLTPTRMLATFLGQRVKLVPRAIIYVLTSGIFYIFVAFLLEYIFGQAMSSVGIYLPLLVLEPLIIKRYASSKRERISTSFKKGVVTTIGFCLVLFIIAGTRELLATGQIGGIEILRVALFPAAALPVGGFILLGLTAAIWRGLVNSFKKTVSLGVKQIQ